MGPAAAVPGELCRLLPRVSSHSQSFHDSIRASMEPGHRGEILSVGAPAGVCLARTSAVSHSDDGGLLASTLVFTARSIELAQMWGSYCDILIGCLLGLLMHDRRGYEYLRTFGRTDLTACFVLLVLAAATLGRLSGAQFGERWFSLAAAAAIAALVTNTGAPTKLASHRWLQSVAWSYAIYLTHPIAFDFWKRLLPVGRLGDYLSLVLTCATDFPFCWILHTWIEKPLIGVGRRATLRLGQTPLAASYE